MHTKHPVMFNTVKLKGAGRIGHSRGKMFIFRKLLTGADGMAQRQEAGFMKLDAEVTGSIPQTVLEQITLH